MTESGTASEVTVQLVNINVGDRIRDDFGDLAGLKASIKEYGIIQPIVITRDQLKLIAGGRRLRALTELGYKELIHGQQFVFRDEVDPLRLQAMELEENLKRKDLEWSEIVLGKQRLLKLMQNIHGEKKLGHASKVVGSVNSDNRGFGVRDLAAMLGESPATTSQDLEVAGYVEKFPSLAKLPTKNDARRKLGAAVIVASMKAVAEKKKIQASLGTDGQGAAAPKPRLWELHRGEFQSNIVNIQDASVDLIATDLPYACGLGDSSAAHGAGLGGFGDTFDNASLSSLLKDVAKESYRILANNRFAVFFFGANYYVDLYQALTQVGFIVDPYWFIWRRDRTAPPSPSRYAKTYDPALICSKGTPTLLRPNLGNFADIASVRGSDRLHAAQKPVEVMERFVLDMTAEGATVVDMFAGSGTTGVAAVKNKRHAILFEKEEPNCVLIESRLSIL